MKIPKLAAFFSHLSVPPLALTTPTFLRASLSRCCLKDWAYGLLLAIGNGRHLRKIGAQERGARYFFLLPSCFDALSYQIRKKKKIQTSQGEVSLKRITAKDHSKGTIEIWRICDDDKICTCLLSQAKRVFLFQRRVNKYRKTRVCRSGVKGEHNQTQIRECFSLRPACSQEGHILVGLRVGQSSGI